MYKTLVLFLLFPVYLCAQESFSRKNTIGLNLYSGLGKMSVQNGWSPKLGTPFSPSYSFGFEWQRNISGKSFIQTQILFEYLNGIEKTLLFIIDSSNYQILEAFNISRSKKAIYISLPIMYKFVNNKISFMAGINISYNLMGDLRFDPNRFVLPSGALIRDPGSAVGIQVVQGFKRRTFQYGPVLAFGYMLNKKWEIQIRYYHCLTNILADSYQSNEKWKVRNIQIGISYLF